MNNYVVVKQNKNSLAIYNIHGPFDSYGEANDLVKEKREEYADQPHLTFEAWLLDWRHVQSDTLTFTPDQSLLDRLDQ